MYFGFCLRVLVLSLLTLGQDANALGERRGGSSGIEPLFEYTSNHKLVLPSDIESSAQAGRFIGSSGSSHSAVGQVDRYSPQGSVSSYGSNPNAKGVIQTKAGMWDYVSPENGKRFVSGIASSGGIVMQAGPQPPSEPQPSVYQSKLQQAGYQSPSGYQPQQAGYQPKTQQPHHQSPSGYQPKPQQAGYQPQQAGYQSPSGYQPQQAGYQSPSGYQPMPQQAGYQPQQAGYRPQQAGYQSPSGYQPQLAGYQSPSGYQPKPQQAGYQPQQAGYQSPSGYQPQQPHHQSPSGYQPKPQQAGYQSPSGYQPKPQQAGYQSPSGFQPKPQQPHHQSPSGFQPKPQQAGYQSPSAYQPKQPHHQSPSAYQPQQPHHQSPSGYKPKTQQVGIQIQPGMSELFSPTGGVSGRNMPPINLNVQMTVPPRTRHIPMSSQQRPRWQHSMVPL